MEQIQKDIESFVEQWPVAQDSSRRIFVELKTFLQGQAGTSLSLKQRPGVTYSLRAMHQSQSDKPLFVMIDVIDDEPRWLSVCFYDQMVSDPGELGNHVPGGLLGEDGLCFDVERHSGDLLSYLKERILEAHKAASVEALQR